MSLLDLQVECINQHKESIQSQQTDGTTWKEGRKFDNQSS